LVQADFYPLYVFLIRAHLFRSHVASSVDKNAPSTSEVTVVCSAIRAGLKTLAEQTDRHKAWP
ncbi:MAG: hypothetical protein ACXWER_01770, partial [Halobacteriota archaeon]